jgi:hypothetical protein
MLSAVSGSGLKDALFALTREIGRAHQAADPDAATAIQKPWSP